jgi:hypothetical protein
MTAMRCRCGKEFEKLGNRKTCSEACYLAHRRAVRKAYYAENYSSLRVRPEESAK